MGLFDCVQTSNISYNNGVMDDYKKRTDRSNEKHISEEAIKLNAEKLKAHNNGLDFISEKMKIAREESLVMNDFNKILPRVNEVKTVVTKEEAINYINDSKIIFENTLKSSLFVNKINTIIMEACPIDESTKDTPNLEEKIYSMVLDSYNELNSTKDFNKLINENALPPMICDLYETSKNYADIESTARFNTDIILEGCDFNIDKIKNKVQNEMNNVCIQDDFYLTSFENETNDILLQNEDVINDIKSKVTGELTKYNENENKMKDIKNDINIKREKINESLDNNGNTDTSTEPEKTDNSTTSTNDTNIDASKNTDTPPANTSDTTSNTPKDDQSNKSTNTSDTQPSSTTSTEKTNDENSNVKSQLPADVAMEIDDAASFAESYTHTFNTGSEKFDDLYKKYSQELVRASEVGDINALNALQYKAKAAADRISKINITNGKKYDDSSMKLLNLASNISFELNKQIENKKKTTQESRSVFESILLSVGKRQLQKITNEGGNITNINGKIALEEALINYTILESFNTLKLIDLTNKDEKKNFIESFNLPINTKKI